MAACDADVVALTKAMTRLPDDEAVELVMKFSGDVNALGYNGVTPLVLAVMTGLSRTVEALAIHAWQYDQV
jgi:hypothetical protein